MPGPETYLAVPAAYLVGSIPFAFLIGRMAGLDLRKVGTRNVGAGNLSRMVSVPAGVAAALGDGLKGFLPIVAAQRLGFAEATIVMIALASVLGHNWSVFLGFTGGRGLATSAGVVFALDPKLLVWPGLWSVAGWMVGGGLAGFVAWTTLPAIAVLSGQAGLVITVCALLPIVVIAKRVMAFGSDDIESALTRAVFDTDRGVEEPRTNLE